MYDWLHIEKKKKDSVNFMTVRKLSLKESLFVARQDRTSTNAMIGGTCSNLTNTISAHGSQKDSMLYHWLGNIKKKHPTRQISESCI